MIKKTKAKGQLGGWGGGRVQTMESALSSRVNFLHNNSIELTVSGVPKGQILIKNNNDDS